VLGVAFGGWQVSGLGSFYTGAPFTVTTSSLDPGGPWPARLQFRQFASRHDLRSNANAPHAYAGVLSAANTYFNTALLRGVPAIRQPAGATPDAASSADPASATWTPA